VAGSDRTSLSATVLHSYYIRFELSFSVLSFCDMSTPAVPIDSHIGLASFTGFALIGNPEYISNSRTLNLSARLFLGSGSVPALFGSLQFLNTGNNRIVVSEGPPRLFFIEATVCYPIF